MGPVPSPRPFGSHSPLAPTLTGSSGPPVPSTPLGSVPSCSPRPLAQPEGGPGPAAAPRPQGNRREPMTDRRPTERGRLSTSRTGGEPARSAARPSARVANPLERSASDARPGTLSRAQSERRRTEAPPAGPAESSQGGSKMAE
nr:translation initiation factor IF-2-like isoform X2 [Symphalangus syndactylus]